MTTIDIIRSDTMYALHEALARERMRETEQRSSQARLVRRLHTERRYGRAVARRRRPSGR